MFFVVVVVAVVVVVVVVAVGDFVLHRCYHPFSSDRHLAGHCVLESRRAAAGLCPLWHRGAGRGHGRAQEGEHAGQTGGK